MSLGDVFPWSIVFDSSCKTPRIHARPTATSFWTQRDQPLGWRERMGSY